MVREDDGFGPTLLLLNAMASVTARWLSVLFDRPVPASFLWNQVIIGLLERAERGFCCGLGEGSSADCEIGLALDGDDLRDVRPLESECVFSVDNATGGMRQHGKSRWTISRMEASFATVNIQRQPARYCVTCPTPNQMRLCTQVH